MYNQLTFGSNSEDGRETQKEFYGQLSAELIDNTYNFVTGKRATVNASPTTAIADCDVICGRSGAPRCGTCIHLTPTKRKRKNQMGKLTTSSFQGRCIVCGKKTMHQCSECKDSQVDKDEGWLCHTDKGRMCFPHHLVEDHPSYE